MVLVPVVVAAIDFGNTDLETIGNTAGYGGTNTNLPTIIGRVIKVVLSLLGLVAMVLIVVAGVQWMTSAGNEDKIKAAKKLMTSALIGMVIIILAYALTNFIISKLVEVTASQ